MESPAWGIQKKLLSGEHVPCVPAVWIDTLIQRVRRKAWEWRRRAPQVGALSYRNQWEGFSITINVNQ